MQALLIDDHALFRDALSLLIGSRFPHWQLQAAGSLAEGLRAVAAAMPHLVLLDLDLPDASGLQAVHALREAAPDSRIVVLSADDRHETVQAALEAGACGFVPKSADARLLGEALDCTLAGGVYLPPQTLLTAAAVPATESPLTQRQLEVLQLLVEGQPNKGIARRLALSESSVKTHLEAIYERLAVNNRTQAVVMAARLGLRWTAPAA